MTRFNGALVAGVTSSLVLTSVALGEIEKPEIAISGFFDGYYSQNFNSPKQPASLSSSSVSSAGIPAANNNYRYYDSYHNQFTISLIELTVKAAVQDVSIVTDLDFGSFADLNASTASTAGQVTDESSKHVGQVVVTYKAPGSRFVFDAGKMYSHLGFETVKSKDNFNYSRSILFSYAIPFWHTGVHLGFDAIPEKLQTSIFIYNGWNTLYDNNRSKSVGLQLRYTPTKNSTITYNYLGGPERSDSESDWKTVHELNASVAVSDRWLLIFDSVYGTEENAAIGTARKRALWYGGILGARLQIDERSYISPRYELYRDADGYSLGGQPQAIHSLTLTYGRNISSALEARVEARSDFSDQNSFATDSGSVGRQSTLLAAMLAHF